MSDRRLSFRIPTLRASGAAMSLVEAQSGWGYFETGA